MKWRCLFLSLSLFLGPAAKAQDFVPPRPPPVDPTSDFEEMEEDMLEMGDEGFRPPPAPGTPPPNSTAPPIDIRPSGGGATGTAFGQNSKLKFQLVDGEYWEKGKKRGRGKKLRANN